MIEGEGLRWGEKNFPLMLMMPEAIKRIEVKTMINRWYKKWGGWNQTKKLIWREDWGAWEEDGVKSQTVRYCWWCLKKNNSFLLSDDDSFDAEAESFVISELESRTHFCFICSLRMKWRVESRRGGGRNTRSRNDETHISCPNDDLLLPQLFLFSCCWWSLVKVEFSDDASDDVHWCFLTCEWSLSFFCYSSSGWCDVLLVLRTGWRGWWGKERWNDRLNWWSERRRKEGKLWDDVAQDWQLFLSLTESEKNELLFPNMLLL